MTGGGMYEKSTVKLSRSSLSHHISLFTRLLKDLTFRAGIDGATGLD